MAGTSASSFVPHVIGSTVFELSRINRTAAPFAVRISAKANGSPTCDNALAEGPSCIFVGPIETASQETLEALYRQARDAYYSGEPLIVDDMFDRVELKLRWYRSKSIIKYPRCSLRRQSTYADAEEDLSQAFALASIWILFLAFGSSACMVPIIYTVGLAYQDAFSSGSFYSSQGPVLEFLATLNGILFMALGSVIGYPIASASVGTLLIWLYGPNLDLVIAIAANIIITYASIPTVKVLQGLWRNDLVALKGVCPNCGEEVFAFVRPDQCNKSPHRSDCHVCGSLLEFHIKVEQSASRFGRGWVYGRIYLVRRRRSRQSWL